MIMSNSKLICYTRLSPNCNKPRNHKIDTITIHHMAGNLTVEQCGALFASPTREVSSNYGIGTDGRIALYVDEANRSWCSSSPANDNRAITIEVANDGGDPDWHVSDKAMASLINLCVDICKRNGIKKLNYTGDTSGNLTMHKWFAATGCPGPYLGSKFPYIAAEVNKRLGTKTTAKATATTKHLYRIRKSWADSKSQIGAYSNLNNAKKACKAGYTVYDEMGRAVYSAPAAKTPILTKGSKITLKGAKLYVSAGGQVPVNTLSGNYYLYDGKLVSGRYRITTSKSNCGRTPVGLYVTGWVNKGEIK